MRDNSIALRHGFHYKGAQDVTRAIHDDPLYLPVRCNAESIGVCVEPMDMVRRTMANPNGMQGMMLNFQIVKRNHCEHLTNGKVPARTA